MATKKGVSINKIGGAGLMESRKVLSTWINAIINDAKDSSQLVVVVVSALAGVTRLLDAYFDAVKNSDSQDDQNKLIEKIIDIHFVTIDRLIPGATNLAIRASLEIKGMIRDVKGYLEVGKLSTLKRAKISAYGERMSSIIFQYFLKSESIKNDIVDARNMILCKGDPLKATILMEDTIRRIKHHFFCRGSVLPIEGELLPMITQGYIAQNESSCDVVMGYDSSDLTAALIARALSEVFNKNDETISVRYWKDVEGVFVELSDSKKGIYPVLDYQGYLNLDSGPILKEAIETLRGTKTIAEIRTFKNPKKPGTVIVPDYIKESEVVSFL